MVILGTHNDFIKFLPTCPKTALMECQAFWQVQWASAFGIYFPDEFEAPSETPFQSKTFPIRIFLSLLLLLSTLKSTFTLKSVLHRKSEDAGWCQGQRCCSRKEHNQPLSGFGNHCFVGKLVLFWGDSANTICGVLAPQKSSAVVIKT